MTHHEAVARHLNYTAQTMRETAHYMRKLCEEEATKHAAELENAAAMVDGWAKELMQNDQ